ncbi:hypothetical protein CKO20_10125 [Rhodocyclus tenuis]|nr:hypothetical protein [Rhodocyclus tenuis]
MPGSVRVAVAADADESLSRSFGNCRAFLIYQVSASAIRLIDRRLPDASAKMIGCAAPCRSRCNALFPGHWGGASRVLAAHCAGKCSANHRRLPMSRVSCGRLGVLFSASSP